MMQEVKLDDFVEAWVLLAEYPNIIIDNII